MGGNCKTTHQFLLAHAQNRVKQWECNTACLNAMFFHRKSDPIIDETVLISMGLKIVAGADLTAWKQINDSKCVVGREQRGLRVKSSCRVRVHTHPRAHPHSCSYMDIS
jgi:hypothetical protein